MPKLKALMVAGVTTVFSRFSPFQLINLLVPRVGYRVHRGRPLATTRASSWMSMCRTA